MKGFKTYSCHMSHLVLFMSTGLSMARSHRRTVRVNACNVSPETLHDFRQSILLKLMQRPIGDHDGTEIKISNGRHV